MTPEQAAIVYNGLIAFAGGLLLYLGTMLSKKAKAAPVAAGTSVELAGAVINGKDAKMLAESFMEAAAEMRALRLQLAEVSKALVHNAEKADDVREATHAANNELRNLANALWANGRK